MNAQFQLLFHADHFKFALVKEFDDWRQEFSKLREALSFAKKEGAKELPFFVIDEGELFSESLVSVEPKNRNSTLSDSQELSEFITRVLGQRARCRVFSDVLNRCWPLPLPEQETAARNFAHEHGWEVTVHEPAGYGIVADFTRR